MRGPTKDDVPLGKLVGNWPFLQHLPITRWFLNAVLGLTETWAAARSRPERGTVGAHGIGRDDMERYVGVDVSLETLSVCVMDRTGRILREVKVATEREARRRKT